MQKAPKSDFPHARTLTLLEQQWEQREQYQQHRKEGTGTGECGRQGYRFILDCQGKARVWCGISFGKRCAHSDSPLLSRRYGLLDKDTGTGTRTEGPIYFTPAISLFFALPLLGNALFHIFHALDAL